MLIFGKSDKVDFGVFGSSESGPPPRIVYRYKAVAPKNTSDNGGNGNNKAAKLAAKVANSRVYQEIIMKIATSKDNI